MSDSHSTTENISIKTDENFLLAWQKVEVKAKTCTRYKIYAWSPHTYKEILEASVLGVVHR
jgi:hypothetical protein